MVGYIFQDSKMCQRKEKKKCTLLGGIYESQEHKHQKTKKKVRIKLEMIGAGAVVMTFFLTKTNGEFWRNAYLFNRVPLSYINLVKNFLQQQ